MCGFDPLDDLLDGDMDDAIDYFIFDETTKKKKDEWDNDFDDDDDDDW